MKGGEKKMSEDIRNADENDALDAEEDEFEMTVKKQLIVPTGEYTLSFVDAKTRPVTSKGKTYTYIDYYFRIDQHPDAPLRRVGFYADLGMGTKHYKFISQFVKLDEGKTYKPSQLASLVRGIKAKGYIKHEVSKKDPNMKYAVLSADTIEKLSS